MKTIRIMAALTLLALFAAGCSKNYGPYQPIDSKAIPRPELGLKLKVVRVDDILRLFSEFKSDSERVLLVTQVKENKPAAKAGVQQGDLLLRIDGIPVNGMRQSVAVMQRKKPGETVKLDLYRRGGPVSVVATLGK